MWQAVAQVNGHGARRLVLGFSVSGWNGRSDDRKRRPWAASGGFGGRATMACMDTEANASDEWAVQHCGSPHSWTGCDECQGRSTASKRALLPWVFVEWTHTRFERAARRTECVVWSACAVVLEEEAKVLLPITNARRDALTVIQT